MGHFLLENNNFMAWVDSVTMKTRSKRIEVKKLLLLYDGFCAYFPVTSIERLCQHEIIVYTILSQIKGTTQMLDLSIFLHSRHCTLKLSKTLQHQAVGAQ